MSATWQTDGWRIAGARELFEAARPALERAADEHRSERGPRALGSFAAFFKGSRLTRGPALRHALRRALGRAEIPRLQEFANLAWLRERGFLAPRPLLAGVRAQRGLPHYQFLFSEFVRDAPDLAELFARAPNERVTAELRGSLLSSLARDLAGLHALRFVHCDLFPRNLLACSTPTGPRCLFLDGWRSAPGRSRRAPEHDLGCFFLENFFGAGETARFLDVYEEERSRLGRPVPHEWPARVERARAAVHRREARRRPGIPPDWEFPSRLSEP